MANNKIGIEIQTKFPTISELRDQVKAQLDNKIELKVKLGVSRESMTALKTQVQNALDNAKKFEIHLNTEKATKQLNDVIKQVKEIDALMSKKHSLKLDFNIKDMDKSFAEILKNSVETNKKITQNTKKQTDEVTKATNEMVKKQIAGLDKVEQKYKEVYDKAGNLVGLQSVEQLSDGRTLTTNIDADGNMTNSITANYQKQAEAVRELEQYLKQTYDLEKKIVTASGEYKKELEKQLETHKKVQDTLEKQYQEKYKENALDNEAIANTKKRLDNELNIVKAKEKDKQTQQEVAKCIEEVVKAEKERINISKQLENAMGKEKEHLQQQLNEQDKNIAKIKEKYNYEKLLNSEQKEQIDAIKKSYDLESKRKSLREQDKAVMKELLDSLNKSAKAEKEILEIKTRAETAGRDLTASEKERVAVLEVIAKEENNIYNNLLKTHTLEGKITDDMQKQLDDKKRINAEEQERATAIAKARGEQEKENNFLKEYKSILSQINGLSDQMASAGKREKEVLEKQVNLLEQRKNEITKAYQAEGKMTDELKQQLSIMERQSAEERELNRERQQAYSMDRELGETSTGWLQLDTAWGYATRGYDVMMDSLKELDDVMLGIKKVAEGTDEQFRKLGETSYDTASKFGITAEEYLKAVEGWAIAGESLVKAQELGKITSVGAFSADVSTEDMQTYIQVPKLAFEVDDVDANDIINVMNELSNNYATTADVIGEAYTRSATTVRQTGKVTFEELSAMITTAQHTTQKGGEKIGTSLKTVALNIGQIQAQASKDAEKKYGFLTGLGIGMKDASGEAESMTRVLEQLAGVWDDLSSEDRTLASTYIAGKEHAETIQAIVSNWDIYSKALSTASGELGNGEYGSAYIELAKGSDSLKFKLAELQNAWDELMYTINNSGGNFMGDIVEKLTTGLNVLIKFAENPAFITLLKFLGGSLMMKAGLNSATRFFEMATKSTKGYLAPLSSLKGLFGQVGDSAGQATSRMQRYHGATGNGVKASSLFSGGIKGVAKGFLGFLPIIGDAILLIDTLSGGMISNKIFDTLANWTKSAEEKVEEIKESTQKIIANNGIFNGEVTNLRLEIDAVFEEVDGYKLNTGDIAPENWDATRNALNALAEELEIEYRLTVNDTSAVEKMQKLIKEAYQIQARQEAQKAAEKIEESAEAVEKATKKKVKAEKALKDLYEEQAFWQEEANKARADQDWYALSEAESQLESINDAIEAQQGKIKDANEELKAYNEQFETLKKSAIEDIRLGGDFSNYDGYDRVQEAIVVATVQDYEGTLSKLSSLEDASKRLNNNGKLTKEEFEALTGAISDAGGSFAYTWEQYEAGVEGASDAVKEAFNSTVEGLEAQLTAQKEILDSIEASSDWAYKYNEETGQLTQVINEAKNEVIDLNNEIKALPVESQIALAVTSDEQTKADLEEFYNVMEFDGEEIATNFLATTSEETRQVIADALGLEDIEDVEAMVKILGDPESKAWVKDTMELQTMPDKIIGLGLNEGDLKRVEESLSYYLSEDKTTAIIKAVSDGSIDDLEAELSELTETGRSTVFKIFSDLEDASLAEAEQEIEEATKDRTAEITTILKGDSELANALNGLVEEKYWAVYSAIIEGDTEKIRAELDDLGGDERQTIITALLDEMGLDVARKALDSVVEKPKTALLGVEVETEEAETLLNNMMGKPRSIMFETDANTKNAEDRLTNLLEEPRNITVETDADVTNAEGQITLFENTPWQTTVTTDADVKKAKTNIEEVTSTPWKTTVDTDSDTTDAKEGIEAVANFPWKTQLTADADTKKADTKIKESTKPKDVKVNLVTGTISNFLSKIFGGNSVSVKANVSENQSTRSSSFNNLFRGSASSFNVSSSSDTDSGEVTNFSTKSNDSNNAKVNEDVWRYWKKEMDISGIQASIDKLTEQISRAGEDYAKMISLYKQQQKLMKDELALQKSLKSAKDSELDSVLKQLKKYGFSVNTTTNQVTNLNHAKTFKGDKATEVEELLNKWQSLWNDIASIDKTINSLNNSISDLNDDIKQAEIAKELKSFEKQLKRIDSLLKKVSNSDDIFNTKFGGISSQDTELALALNEDAMNQAQTNAKDLMNEFNKLSTATVKHAENAEELQSQLESLKDEILSQADAVIEYQKAMNDLEISRITSDLDKFNEALSRNQDRLSDVVDNLKEGLLSGTTINDLVSATTVGLDFGRSNQFDKIYGDRISLEEQLQKALDNYAIKNVERTKSVANAELQVQANKYNELLKMQNNYASSGNARYSEITVNFGLDDTDRFDSGYQFAKELGEAFTALRKKQDELTKKYYENLEKATSQSDKDALTSQYIIDNLKLQEEYYKAQIEANNEAIDEFYKLLKDNTLTDEQRETIKAQINDLVDENISAQNSIKDTIGSRFEYEFSLLDEALKKYDEYNDKLDYAQGILDILGGSNYEAQGILLNQMFSSEQARNQELKQSLKYLEEQLAMYEQGSYEWKLINEQVKEYQQLLQDSNLSLLEGNKGILSNTLADIMEEIEKSLFDGMTLEDFKDFHNTWMTGVERELELESMYQRIADLGEDVLSSEMAVLEKREKIGRDEIEFLNKQLDILEAERKLADLQNNKTIQMLKQQSDGSWDWVYEADQDAIDEVQKEIEEAQKELEELRQQAEENYASKLQDILSKIESGRFNSLEDLQEALSDLEDAFSGILGEDFVDQSLIDKILDAYEEYMLTADDILNGIGNSDPITQEGLAMSIAQSFKDIAGEIGDAIGDAVRNALQASSYSTPASRSLASDQAQNFYIDKLEFPNVKSSEDIQNALMNLPNIARQKAMSK